MSKKHDHQPEQQPDLSIIIVNYNVKEFLANCLQSVRRATAGQQESNQESKQESKQENNQSSTLQTEIFVIDNASSDQSVEFLKPRFPDVTFIQNETNVGFGKANNQAIPLAKGRYTLLLNPDTLLQEDTLRTLTEFMDRHPEAGACGCKILNPDGSFAAESRRSVPTVSSAFYKASGLTALFPKHRRFGRYYLGWLDEDEPSEIPVLSGSFMFFRTQVLQQAGGFDDRFFMYGEDIDLCYRVNQAGHKLFYVPDTSIIHYKGESSKRDDFTYNKVFNDALFLFFDKHYTSRYSKLLKGGVWLAVKMRTLATFTLAKLRGIREAGIDLLVLNLSLFLALGIRIGFDPSRLFSVENLPFLWLNLLLSILYMLYAQSSGLLKSNKDSLPDSLKTVLLSFISLVVLTFFLRDLAFSRIIIVVAALIALGGVLSVRLARINRKRRPGQSEGKVKPTRVLLVGTGPGTAQMADNLNSRVHWHVEITGVLGQKGPGTDALVLEEAGMEEAGMEQAGMEDSGTKSSHHPPYLGSTIHIERVVRETKTNLVIFLMESVTHTELIECVRRLKDLDVDTKVVPDQMNFLIGKAEVEYLDDLPLIRLDLPYFQSVQRFLKRSFDLVLSSFLLGVMMPLTPVLAVSRGRKAFREASTDTYQDVMVWDGKKEHRIRLLIPGEGVAAGTRGARETGGTGENWTARWENRRRVLSSIWLGRLSFVGAPAHVLSLPDSIPNRVSMPNQTSPLKQASLPNPSGDPSPPSLFHQPEKKDLRANTMQGMRFRTGLTGYAQLNQSRIRRESDRELFDLYYLQNYSLWLDIDILLKSLARGTTLLTAQAGSTLSSPSPSPPIHTIRETSPHQSDSESPPSGAGKT